MKKYGFPLKLSRWITGLFEVVCSVLGYCGCAKVFLNQGCVLRLA